MQRHANISGKAKVLFWRLVQRLKKNDATNSKDAIEHMSQNMEHLFNEVHSMKAEMRKFNELRLQKQNRLEEIEEKISENIDHKVSQVREIEQQILNLEKLHTHYSKNAPEHKEHLDRIKEKIDQSKAKLSEIKSEK